MGVRLHRHSRRARSWPSSAGATVANRPFPIRPEADHAVAHDDLGDPFEPDSIDSRIRQHQGAQIDMPTSKDDIRADPVRPAWVAQDEFRSYRQELAVSTTMK